ncbi:hypothetical protein [Hyphomicrobium sp.]|uniref:hypothetical protein n=1 Tax=Hyphomicrobium sp. TaxID=82 RepID=UPI001D1F26F4|nr:hypothetical protein [Hyphomicrobium sp.]MBY0559848.1 hypothetical protein [Hyphomicrobium sp.]
MAKTSKTGSKGVGSKKVGSAVKGKAVVGVVQKAGASSALKQSSGRADSSRIIQATAKRFSSALKGLAKR